MLLLSIILLYFTMSLITFCMYGIDKSAARNGSWRISESALLAVGLLGGWPGALAAQSIFRHKTVKTSFLIMLWLTVIVNIAFLAVIFFLYIKYMSLPPSYYAV